MHTIALGSWADNQNFFLRVLIVSVFHIQLAQVFTKTKAESLKPTIYFENEQLKPIWEWWDGKLQDMLTKSEPLVAVVHVDVGDLNDSKVYIVI